MCLSTLIHCPWAYGSSLKEFYPAYLCHILGFWVTCGVKMMALRHGWDWQPPQTASHIHIRHIQRLWAHWYAVHGKIAVASKGYTQLTWLVIWGSGSLVESKWCDYVMIEGDCHLKLLPASTYDIYKVIDTLICCPWAWGSSLKQSYPHYLAQILGF